MKTENKRKHARRFTTKFKEVETIPDLTGFYEEILNEVRKEITKHE